MKHQVEVCYDAYFNSMLTFDSETLIITYKEYSWNSHGTTETCHGEIIVNPPELYSFLVEHCKEERAKEIMENPDLIDVCERYAEQVRPFREAFQELQRRSPLDWKSWELGARLYAGGSSSIFEAKRSDGLDKHKPAVPKKYLMNYIYFNSHYRRYGELRTCDIHPGDEKSKRLKRYLNKIVLAEAKRESLLGLTSGSVLKFSKTLPARTDDDARAVCAFLMRHRNEDTIRRLNAWHMQPAVNGRFPWLIQRLEALQPLTSGVPKGISLTPDVFRLYFERVDDSEYVYFYPSRSHPCVWVRALPPDYVLRQGRRIAKALSLCHRNGIVHRDVTVDNLFRINKQKDLCLGDFGIACRLPTRFSPVAYGTPVFMPPEMLDGQPYGFSADVFALGRCMQLMLWGMQLPYASHPLWAGTLEREKLTPAVSDAFWQVMRKATAADAAERYPDGSSLLEALNGVESAV